MTGARNRVNAGDALGPRIDLLALGRAEVLRYPLTCMAWRIHDHVVRGEIDNRTRGRITGRIWLAGIQDPLTLDLAGDGHPDVAGCLLTFVHPRPIDMTTKPPALHQHGTAGDFTAARKVRVPDVSIEEFVRRTDAPWHWANALYLEWFSERCGRFVIESADYQLTISPPVWSLTATEVAEREEARREGTSEFDSVVQRDGEDAHWDEFRHEQMLRESDALTERYGRLLKKYQDHPDLERIIAREMGWSKIEDALAGPASGPEEEEATAAAEAEEIARMDELDDEFDPELPDPDPEREGIDWVRGKDGDIVHPIEKRAGDALYILLDEMKANPALEKSEDEDFGDFLGHYMSMSAKLAGALGGLARGWREMEEASFTIALLKRILEILHKAIAAGDALSKKTVLPADRLAFYRGELFAVREQILALITRLRG